MSHKLKNAKRSGFTLIELLVVIAIIAILAAILFPVFARARENARRASCQSNLKQIGLGIMQYTQDYDEKYPTLWGPNYEPPHYRQKIFPYVKSTQLFRCPSNPNNNNIAEQAAAGYPAMNASYVVNGRIIGRGETDWLSVTGTGTPLSLIQSPATKIMATESLWNDPEIGAWGSWGWDNQFAEGGFAGHLNTWVCLYADGHVKSMRPTRTMTPQNQWGSFQDIDNEPGCGNPWGGNSGINGFINCDVVSPGALGGLQKLEQRYQ